MLLRSNVSVNIVDGTKGRRVKSNTLPGDRIPNSSDLLYLPFLRPSTRPSILFYTYDFGIALALVPPIETHFYRYDRSRNGPAVLFISPLADQSSDTRRTRNKDPPFARGRRTFAGH